MSDFTTQQLENASRNDLVKIAARALEILNQRESEHSWAKSDWFIGGKKGPAPSQEPLSDWSLYDLYRQIVAFDDEPALGVDAMRHDLGIDDEGNKLDDNGEPVGDGYEDQVRGDYVFAQTGA